MAKIDDVLAALHAGFNNPGTALYQTTINEETRKSVRLRSKDAAAATHLVWVLSIGEQGATPHVVFYGYKPSDCIKQALTWRGLPTASKGKNAGQPQTQAG